jgi:hypothetical protein
VGEAVLVVGAKVGEDVSGRGETVGWGEGFGATAIYQRQSWPCSRPHHCNNALYCPK